MSARILLTEDNQSLSDILSNFLIDNGYDVVTAGNGLEAFQVISQGRVDLLLLDLKLPVMRGVELLRKLRETTFWAALPIVIMSGVFKGAHYIEAVQRLGIDHYLEKPFTRKAFLDAVQASLAERKVEQGSFNLLDQIITIYNGRKSGLLTLKGGYSPVSFLNGEPFSFFSRGREEFPAFLVARGEIGLGDLHHFVASGEDRLYFTKAGLLPYEDLVKYSRLFLTKTLTDALKANLSADFAVATHEAELPPVPLLLTNLVYETTKESSLCPNPAFLLKRLGPLFPARTALFFRRINLTILRREDIETLELVNGSRTLNEILASKSSPGDGAEFFHFLLSFGMIQFYASPSAEESPDFPQKTLFNRPLEEIGGGTEETMDFHDLVDQVSDTVEIVVGENDMAAPLSTEEISFEQMVQRDFALMKDKNYYEIFGLSPASFTFSKLKESYFEKTRRYTPERFMELSGNLHDLAQEVLGHYAGAYNTLSNVVAKESYDEILSGGMANDIDGRENEKLQVRIQYQSGKVFLEMGDYGNAEKALNEAYTLEPDNPLFSAFLAWAMYRNPANSNSETMLKKARMLLGRSIQAGKTSEAFAFRGRMLLDEGREVLAEAEFQKALQLDQQNTIARKGIRIIEENREKDKKGFFRRIFG